VRAREATASGLGALGHDRHMLTWAAAILALLVTILLELGMDQVLTRPFPEADKRSRCRDPVGIAVRPARCLSHEHTCLRRPKPRETIGR
jgi:hypothetical protein